MPNKRTEHDLEIANSNSIIFTNSSEKHHYLAYSNKLGFDVIRKVNY